MAREIAPRRPTSTITVESRTRLSADPPETGIIAIAALSAPSPVTVDPVAACRVLVEAFASEIAGAPYADEVAISVNMLAVEGSIVASAFSAAAASGARFANPTPTGWLPPPVGIISTYWETAEAGPPSAAAPAGTAIAMRAHANAWTPI